MERGGPGTTSRLGGPACRHEGRSRWFGTGQRGVRERTGPGSAGRSGLRARGCAGAAHMVARDPAARKAAQVKVRSKFHAKNVETAKSSKLALEEELATLGGCEPIYTLLRSRARWTVQATGRRLLTSLSCVCDILSSTSRFRRSKFHAKKRRDGQVFEIGTRRRARNLGRLRTHPHPLTVAGALDSAGYRSASSYIAELRLRHIELDFAISPALDRAFKKVIDAVCYEGLRPSQESTRGEAFGHPAQYRHDDSRRAGRLRNFVALVAQGR